MNEEDLIRLQFQNILDKLVESKIQPTATAIISARQPMVQLFEELMYKLNKLQKENEKLKKQSEISAKTHIKNDDLKDKVIDKMAKTISGLVLYDFNRKEYFTLEDEGEVKEYFYKKVEIEDE